MNRIVAKVFILREIPKETIYVLGEKAAEEVRGTAKGIIIADNFKEAANKIGAKVIKLRTEREAEIKFDFNQLGVNTTHWERRACFTGREKLIEFRLKDLNTPFSVFFDSNGTQLGIYKLECLPVPIIF
ncbi:MAG: hypothetical protein DRN08_06405 [Thermoplasmata archaeon]|nr:MAG: hypothetical protein DRN08_06405 [Thermoplasmata archaeon]